MTTTRNYDLLNRLTSIVTVLIQGLQVNPDEISDQDDRAKGCQECKLPTAK